MLRALRPKQRTLKFHIHDSLLFQQEPQTQCINRALLRNDAQHWITNAEMEAVQKSFDTLVSGYNVGQMNGNDLMKLYAKVYYPFLNKTQVRDSFKERNMSKLQSYVTKHVRLTQEGSFLLKTISQSKSMDFGVLRGQYFASLGFSPIAYGHLLNSSNRTLFQGHNKQNINFSKVLTKVDGEASVLAMERYLKSSSSLHKSTQLKNYLVVNSPQECEMYANLAQRFGTRIVILTGQNFERSESSVAPLLYDYQMAKLRASWDQCGEIRNALTSLKFLPMRDVNELLQFITVVEEKVGESALASFDETLRQMELSILGHVETDLQV